MTSGTPGSLKVSSASEILISVIEARNITSESDLGSEADFLLRIRLGHDQEAKTSICRDSFQPKWLFDTKLTVPEQGEASSICVELVQVWNCLSTH